MSPVKVFFATFLALAAAQTGCDPGWTNYGTSCYAFYNMPVTFSEASQYCGESGGASLAEIETEMENTHVKNYMVQQNTQHARGAWLGATDTLIEGMWTWDKIEKPVTYFDWADGQPDDDDGRPQDCLALWRDFSFQWVDHWCTEKLGFLCELPAK